MGGSLLLAAVLAALAIQGGSGTEFVFGGFQIPNITSYEGRHVKITVVHDPPGVDVGLANGAQRCPPQLLAPERGKSGGVIYPKADWKGFIPDMIDQISELGNFTYELFLPSGTGFVLLFVQTRFRPALSVYYPESCVRLGVVTWVLSAVSLQLLVHI